MKSIWCFHVSLLYKLKNNLPLLFPLPFSSYYLALLFLHWKLLCLALKRKMSQYIITYYTITQSCSIMLHFKDIVSLDSSYLDKSPLSLWNYSVTGFKFYLKYQILYFPHKLFLRKLLCHWVPVDPQEEDVPLHHHLLLPRWHVRHCLLDQVRAEYQ